MLLLSSDFQRFVIIMSKNSDHRKTMSALSLSTQFGTTIPACILTGVFLGKFLDKTFGTTPWLLLVGSMLGMAASIKWLLDFAKKL